MKFFKLITIGLALAVTTHVYAKDELRIGVEAAYAPFESKNSAGEIVGFDVDIGNAICEKLKMDCVWIEQPFDSLIPGLQARKFDVAHSSMTITEARQKVIDFTTPLYEIPSQLVAHKDSGLEASVDSLKGKNLGVLQGSVQETYARKVYGKKGVKIISYQEQTQTFADLKAGRLDAALFEKPNAIAGFLNTDNGQDFDFIGEPITDDPIMNNEISMGLRKGQDELKEKINGAIVELQKEGKIEEFSKKYFEEGELGLITPEKD